MASRLLSKLSFQGDQRMINSKSNISFELKYVRLTISVVTIFLIACSQSVQNRVEPEVHASTTGSGTVKDTVAHPVPDSPSSKVSSKVYYLKQKSDWKLNLTLVEDPNGSIRPGSHEFSNLRCGGTYKFERREADGRIVLRQRITYGNCVQNCQLVLAKDLSSYRELCSDRDTGGGAFERSLPTFMEVKKTNVEAMETVMGSNGSVVWRRCEIGRTFDAQEGKCIGTPLKFNWVDAIAAVNRLNVEKFEGYSDWRLPSSIDLRYLLENDKNIQREVPQFLARESNRGWDETRVCKYANELISRSFGEVNGVGFNFYGSQRWMTDNDSKDWLSPVSFNLYESFGMLYHGYCNLIAIAYKASKPNEMRAHAQLPIIVVRGGRRDEWDSVQSALASRKKILAGSEAQHAQTMNYYNNMIGGVVKWVQSAAANGSASPQEATARYVIVDDKGRAADVAWYKREIVVKCLKGGSEGNIISTYESRSSGRWSTASRVGTFPTMHDAANSACN